MILFTAGILEAWMRSRITNFDIIFSFLFTILVVYMISNSILSFTKEEEDLAK